MGRPSELRCPPQGILHPYNRSTVRPGKAQPEPSRRLLLSVSTPEAVGGRSLLRRKPMFRTGCTMCAIVALLGAMPVAAQSPGSPTGGTIEVGGFGQWTWFDENAGRENVVPEDGLGYGGR